MRRQTKGSVGRHRSGTAAKWVSVGSLLVAVAALIVSVIGSRDEITSWSGIDWLRPAADESKIRILVAALSADPSGRYTAGLENALSSAKKRFRQLGRPWNPSEDERLDKTLERRRISELLERHESDAFVHGHVGTDSATLWLVPRDTDQDARRYTIESEGDFDGLIADLEPILAQGIQSRIDGAKFSIGKGRHALIDRQIGDLLVQSGSAETRRQLRFHAAFTKDKLAFWRRDRRLADESLSMYESLLVETTDNWEESILRINIGVSYQQKGMRDADIEAFEASTEHFARAEQFFAVRPDVRRWAKARKLLSVSEMWLHSLTGEVEYLVSAIRRQRETFEDASGWLSEVDSFMVFQEGVGAELLLAYTNGDTRKLRHYFDLLVENMDAWRLRAELEGVANSPWVRALINCTGMQLIDPMDLERALLREPVSGNAVTSSNRIEWTNQEITERRMLVESWLSVARDVPSGKTLELQLSRLADLLREEALRTHDVRKLERSFKLTEEYRDLAEVESATISYVDLDPSLLSAEFVLTYEGSLALACADRGGIARVLRLLKRSAATCEAQPEVCAEDISWIDYGIYWLEYGLGRWEPVEAVGPAPSEQGRPQVEPWEHARYHALWLRHDLLELPQAGESFCPSRVPWVA